MRKLRSITAILLFVFIASQLCACRVSLPEPVEMSSADEAAAMGFSEGACESEMAVGDYSFFDVKIKIDYEDEVKWSSSDTKVATVDSDGRVDALTEGQVVITASVKKASVSYGVTVTKAKAKELGNSTAVTANETALEENKNSLSDANLYALYVNTDTRCITAYTYNENGTYNIPVRSMVCSIGETTAEDMYNIESRKQWLYTDKYNYQYATSFGGYCFTSAPYSGNSSDTLVAEEYNKLGTVCTDGNIWLSCADAKWIYDNCTDTTMVKVELSDTKDPLAVPKAMILGENAKYKTWDPTDPDENNPYSKCTPYFEGVDTKAIAVGSTFDYRNLVVAFDTCGNAVTGKIIVDGNVPCDRVGTYVITYTYTDSLNRTGRADRVIQVLSEEEYSALSQQ